MEEEKKPEAVDIQQQAKNIVMKELEKEGVLSEMKAKLKKHILNILDNQSEITKQKLEFDYMTPLYRQNKPKEVMLMCQLIKEFMKFYEMEYTLPIFEKESNVRENIKKPSLLKELGLENQKETKENQKPILIKLLLEYQKLKEQSEKMNTNPFELPKKIGGRYMTDDDIVKDKLINDDQNVIKPNRKLAPISFTINNSVEMNNIDNAPVDSSKFSVLNISDVYKKDKKEPKKEEPPKEKEITSDDILNKDKDKNYDPILGSGADKLENNQLVIGNTDNKPEEDDEFKEQILEEIDNKNKDENEESKKSVGGSTSNINSIGYDSSVKNINLKEFDYAEDAVKPV